MLVPHPSCFSGGIQTLEALLLVALLKISYANRLFEFGTYMGASTVLLAENSKETAQVFTLDLPVEASGALQVGVNSGYREAPHVVEDRFLAAKATAHGPIVADGFYRHAPSKKITFLRGDSKRADLSAYDRSIDMVWVDGGHDYDTVRSDTDNAFRMISPANKNAVIVWHDFDNPGHDVGKFLRELAKDRILYAIGSTFLAFCFPNTDVKRF
jgi:predicted O-methyltransferase YrrM